MMQRSTWLSVLVVAWLAPARAQDVPPPDAPHPEPRVIVTVSRVRGPHDKDAVETAARMAWGRIVRCYKLTPHKGKPPRGIVEARVEIAANGEVVGTRRQGGTLKGELARCLVRTMRKVTMPRARSGSTAEIAIKVGPGDG